jgi:hypothetical protein
MYFPWQLKAKLILLRHDITEEDNINGNGRYVSVKITVSNFVVKKGEGAPLVLSG